MKYLYLFIIFCNILSCGYPDIDNVSDFKDLTLSQEEIYDFCLSTNTTKINIDNCINNYKSKN